MDLSAQMLLNRIRSGEPVPNLVALVGEESFFRQKALNVIVEAVFQGVPESDREIHRFNQDTDFSAVEQAVNSYPFFCGKSLVIIADEKLFEQRANVKDEGLAKRLEPLLPIVANVPDYCTLVFNVPKFNKSLKLFKTIREKGLAVVSEPVRPNALAPWLKDCAAGFGGKFDYTGISRIMEYLAPVEFAPLALLEKEIGKLCLYVGTGKAWTADDVEAVFSDLPELGPFKLSEAVLRGRLQEALKFLRMEQKKPNAVPSSITGMLRYQLKMVIRVMEYRAAGLSVQEMTGRFTDLRSPGYQVQKAAAVRGFSMDKLMWAYRQLGNVDRDLRTLSWSKERGYDRIEEIIVVLLPKNGL